MNIMQIGQRVLPQSLPLWRAARPRPGRVPIRGVLARLQRPGNFITLLVSFLTYLLGIFPVFVYALPTEGTVQAGTATIDQVSDSRLNIYQSTDKAIIDWTSFSIAGGEHVDFQLPSSNSVTLNRITGNDPSLIFGKLSSNGTLMLINRNGILFGQGSQIDVHGLVATTSDISNTDFMSGQYRFNIAPEIAGTVTNRGIITVAEGGLLAFVAPGVQNMGIINARLGRVSLAAGNMFTLDLYGDQLVNLGVDSQVMSQVTGLDGQQLTSLVSNSGSIFADGGTVMMDVRTAQGLIDNVINMSGYIQARSIAEKNGAIYLMGGDDGLVHVSGTLDASGLNAGETGGTVHVLGDRVGLYDFAMIDVSGDAGGGLVLVGGDFQGLGSIKTATDTYVDSNVSIFADAVTGGDGGRTIFWADRRTRFFGTVRARGGRLFGDGGFVEVSGKEELYFAGSVDTRAPNGKTGTLLLDPENITIVDGSGSAASSGSFTFNEATLEAVSATTNIELLANNSITINNLSDNLLSMAQGSGNSVTFTATTGQIVFVDSNDEIRTAGGDIIMSANGTLTLGILSSNGGDITLTGGEFVINNTINSGGGTLTLLASDNGSIGLDNVTGGITTSTVSTICGGACGMTLSGDEIANLNSTGGLVIGGNTNGDIFVDGVSLLHISGGVTLSATATGGTVTFGSTESLLRLLTVNAENGITLNGNVTTELASSFNADSDGDGAGTFTISSGNTLASSLNATIAIVANDVSISGTLSSGTGSTSIAVSDGGTIGLGSTAGGMTINGSELQNITAGTLTIGNSSTGNITVNGITATNSNNITTVNLTTASGSSVSFSNTSSTFNALTVNGGSTSFGSGLSVTTDTGKLTLNSTAITSAGTLTLTGATGIDFGAGVTFTAGGDLTLSTTTGDITGAGAFTLTSTGDITLSENLTTAGVTTITADSDGSGAGDFNQTTGTLSTGGNSLTLTANDVTLSGSINTGTGSVTILVSDGGTIGLGSTAGGMTIDGSELQNITAGTLTIGNSSTGNITVDGITATNSNNITTVNLTTASGSSVSFSTASSTFNALTVNGGSTSFGSGLSVTTDTGKLTLNSTAITSAGTLTLTGATGIDFGAGVTFTAGGNLTMNTTSGGIVVAGAFTLTSTGDITLSEDFTTAGATIITADSNGTGAGTFSLAAGKTLSTGNNSLTLTADDISLSGSINTGTGSVTIAVSDGGTIGLGSTAGNMTIDGSELQNITAGTLTIGNSSTGNITVDGITAANSNNITTVNLITANTSSISFSGAASTFSNGLTASAGNGISQSVNLTTGGTTTFDADSNNDGSGDFTNTAGTLSTGGNAFTLTANDFGLSGSINTGSATTSILVSDGGSIGLGSTAGNMTITDTELGNITAGTLTIGDSTAGAITVDGISSTSNVATVDLNASSITFSNGASTFQSLTATANTGTITGTAALTVTGTSSFTTSASNQNITLSNTSNAFTGVVSLNTTGSSADATLAAGSSLTLGTSTIGGNQSVTVGGTSQTLNVTGVQTAGGTITLQSSGDITLTSSLSTTSSSDSAVSLTSTGGGIFDGDSDGSLDIDAANGRLVVVSNGGFGASGNAIETKMSSVDITNNSTGDVNIFESDSLIITRINQNANNRDIAVSYSGSLSGQDNAKIPDGSTGTITFTQRKKTNARDQIIEGTGKSLGELSVEGTIQLAVTVENQITRTSTGSDEKTVANLDSGGNTSPYTTDAFAEPYTLVEFSDEAREIYDSASTLENFWGTPVKQVDVVKRELSPTSDREARVAPRRAVAPLQKTKSRVKKARWEDMVRKVEAKKFNKKTVAEKIREEEESETASAESKRPRRRPGNLAPEFGARTFERASAPIPRRSFR